MVAGAQPECAAAAEATDNTGAGQAASSVLGTLQVKGRAPKTGYKRTQFGKAWADVDHNGCDTRNDILSRDLSGVKHRFGTHSCVVKSGTLQMLPIPASRLRSSAGRRPPPPCKSIMWSR